MFYVFPGSLPPSPADSGVSDVDPSSSSHNSDDERIHIRQQRNSGTNEKTISKPCLKWQILAQMILKCSCKTKL